MTNEAVYNALAAGHTRFIAKRSGKVYFIHTDQMEILKPFTDDVLLIGFPEIQSPTRTMRRFRGGRKWVWLSPKNIELAG